MFYKSIPVAICRGIAERFSEKMGMNWKNNEENLNFLYSARIVEKNFEVFPKLYLDGNMTTSTEDFLRCKCPRKNL